MRQHSPLESPPRCEVPATSVSVGFHGQGVSTASAPTQRIAGRIFTAALRRLSHPEMIQPRTHTISGDGRPNSCSMGDGPSHGNRIGQSKSCGSLQEYSGGSNRSAGNINNDHSSGSGGSGREQMNSLSLKTDSAFPRSRFAARRGRRRDDSQGKGPSRDPNVRRLGPDVISDRAGAADGGSQTRKGGNCTPRLCLTKAVEALWKTASGHRQLEDEFSPQETTLAVNDDLWHQMGIVSKSDSLSASFARRKKEGTVECEKLGAVMQDVWASAEEAFIFLDGGSNDVLTRAELRAGVARFRIPNLNLDRLLTELDSDRSGLITARNFIRLFSRYWACSTLRQESYRPEVYESARQCRGDVIARFNSWSLRHSEASAAIVPNATNARRDVIDSWEGAGGQLARGGPRSPPATPDPERSARGEGPEGPESGQHLPTTESYRESTVEEFRGPCCKSSALSAVGTAGRLQSATVTPRLPVDQRRFSTNFGGNTGARLQTPTGNATGRQNDCNVELKASCQSAMACLGRCSENGSGKSGSKEDRAHLAQAAHLQAEARERLRKTQLQANDSSKTRSKQDADEQERRRFDAAVRRLAAEEERKIRRKGLRLPRAVGDWSGLRFFQPNDKHSIPTCSSDGPQVPVWTTFVSSAAFGIQLPRSRTSDSAGETDCTQ